jgi:hypothetical protein
VGIITEMDEQAALKPRPLVYTAGPMSARTRAGWWKNVEAGKAVGVELLNLGIAVVCPHLSAHYDTVDRYRDIDWTAFLQSDLAVVRRADAVFLLPGWQDSKGASVEARVARRNGIPTFESIDEMCEHFGIKVPVAA